MTKLAKKFYASEPILHCLAQNIDVIALSRIKILSRNSKSAIE